MRTILTFLVVLCIVMASCVDRHGVIGANFKLRDKSPLPTWIVLPPDITRDQVDVKIVRYEATFTQKCKVRFIISDKNKEVLQKEIGYMTWHPDSERKARPASSFPNWSIIEVKGTKEVYEQSEFNDLLRIVKKPLK